MTRECNSPHFIVTAPVSQIYPNPKEVMYSTELMRVLCGIFLCGLRLRPHRWRNMKMEVLLWKRIRCFLSKLRQWNHRPFCVWGKLRRGNVMTIAFLRFKKRFRKAPFSWRISVDGRPNRRNQAAFSNFSGVVWTRGPKILTKTSNND